ncbi:MAG: FAD-dependent oxidoreductase [Spirochaetes bacterium]|nr:FAD-dependent oxidoreductase [Spirochaetota bacterium]
MYQLLFTPIKINTLEIKNRIAYPALGLLYSYDGTLNDRYYEYFREKAKGGAGLVTVGPVGIDIAGSGRIALSLASDDRIPDFAKLTKIIKGEGARTFVQLFHAGAYSYSMLTDGVQPIAPSAVYSKYSKQTPREMTLEDIEIVQKAYVDAALRAKEAGFDGVEIIASAGYLITQFLSPITNKRTDQYGGSFENRVRFPREVIEKVRRAVGKDFPVSIRMAGNDFVPGSNTSRETPLIAKVYEEAGVDIINVTGGWHEAKVPQLPMELPRAGYAYLAANIKRVVNVPVMASNRISSPDEAEKILKDSMADMVNLGRVLIADPYWPIKAQNGKAKLIRPCVGCNQGCTDTLFSGMPVGCILNARAGYEFERSIEKTRSPLKIMVVGAGPGGLEAAVRAKEAGHDVVIYEKEQEIGGQLHIAAAPPHKHELLEIIRYYKSMIEEYSIPVYCSTTVTIDLIKEVQPDHVILATGAEPLTPPIKGVELPNVYSAWDVLRNNPKLGRNVAVIGGGAVGIETALFIANKGTLSPEVLHFLMFFDAEPVDHLKELITRGTSAVTIIEMLPTIGKDVGRSTRWILNLEMEKYGINVITSATVIEIKDKAVVYTKQNDTIHQEFDNVVIAVGSKPVNPLENELKKLGIAYSILGDCKKIGKINDAIHEAFLAIANLQQVAKV